MNPPTEIRNRIINNELRIITRADVQDHAGNWREHPKAQRAALRGVLGEVGIVLPLIAYHSERNDGQLTLIDGHERITVETAWPAVILDVSDDEADYILTTLDPLAGMATANAEALAQLLQTVKSAEAAVQQMIADLAAAAGLYVDPRPDREYTAPDPGQAIAEALAQQWKTQRGQVWQIRSDINPDLVHRIMVGDSTDAADVARLFGDERADMVLGDPPYGVDYGAKAEFFNQYDKGQRVQTPIEGDQAAEIADYRKFFASFLKPIPYADYNTVYICMLGSELQNLRAAFDDAGLYWSDNLIWVKNNHVIGRKDYHCKHEYIMYGWRKKHKFYGSFTTTVLDDGQDLRKLPKKALIDLVEQLLNDQHTTVIREDKPQKSEYHPTMKPVALFRRFIRDGSAPGAIVYDPFGGSGTTLVAAEAEQRQARIMEKTPEYVAVELERATLIGLQPELIYSP